MILLRWISINSFIAATFYVGITYHNGLAQFAQLYTWANLTIVAMCAAMYVGSSPEHEARRQRLLADHREDVAKESLPILTAVYDFGLAAYLAFNDYIYTALAVLVTYAIQNIIASSLSRRP